MNKNCRLVPERYLNYLAKNEKTRDFAHQMLNSTDRAPLEFCPDVTIHDLMPEDSNGIEYDLPLRIVYDIQEKMNFDIRGHFVSDCRQGFELLPVTTVGRAVLPIINKIIYKE